MEFKLEENKVVTQTRYGELQISSDEEHGFRPFQLMVGSIVGCSILVLKNVLQKMRLTFDDITVRANVERNEQQANRIEKVQLHFTIKGTELPRQKVERALELARKNCPMVQSVANSIVVEETVELIEES